MLQLPESTESFFLTFLLLTLVFFVELAFEWELGLFVLLELRLDL